MSRPGRYSSDEVRRLLERAARIQAEDEGGAAGDVTTADLTAAADQAGISSSALLRAIAEERGLESAARRETRHSASGVEHRLHLPASVTDAGLARAWDVVVKERGDLGQIRELGSSRVWHPKHEAGDGFEVGIRQGDAATDVWIRRKTRILGQTWLPFAVLGGMFVLGLRNPLSLLVAAALFFAVRWGARRAARQKIERDLRKLGDELEAELARPDGL